MMRLTPRLAADSNGSSAAELALALPLLVILLFGPLELGYYLMSEHVVQKAARDAARYAGRLPATNYDCASETVDPTAELQIQRLARTGDPDGTSGAKLLGWTSNGMTSVTLVCETDTTKSYVNSGIYTDFPDGVPVVTVSASVPYPTLFGMVGMGVSSLTLNAQSQTAVFGA